MHQLLIGKKMKSASNLGNEDSFQIPDIVLAKRVAREKQRNDLKRLQKDSRFFKVKQFFRKSHTGPVLPWILKMNSNVVTNDRLNKA